MLTEASKWTVGIKSALRALVTVAAIVTALDAAGLLVPEKLFTWRGIMAILAAIAAKGVTAGATAKTVSVR